MIWTCFPLVSWFAFFPKSSKDWHIFGALILPCKFITEGSERKINYFSCRVPRTHKEKQKKRVRRFGKTKQYLQAKEFSKSIFFPG